MTTFAKIDGCWCCVVTYHKFEADYYRPAECHLCGMNQEAHIKYTGIALSDKDALLNAQKE